MSLTNMAANLIVLEEREVKAKGLNPQNKVDEEKLKGYFFDEDYEKLKLLKEIPKLNLNFEHPTIFYPGCGADIFYPLHYLELFPKMREVSFLFVDENDSFGLIKTQLDDVGISFKGKKNKIKFYWKDKLVNLEFIKDDVKKAFPKIPQYHIYFEKAFRIMREHIPYYEQGVFDKLADGGIIISDSGFEEIEAEKLERIPVPLELSSYGEMMMGRKR